MERIKRLKDRNRLRFFTYSVYNFLSLFIILLFGFIIINILSNKGNLEEAYIFNTRPTIIITGSMEPVIRVNSMVYLEPVEFTDIQVNDIIRYKSNMGYSVLHRVIEKGEDFVITKGDANDSADSLPVYSNQITGRVKEIHNEVADILTIIFGKFSYEHKLGSVLRFCMGFIFIGIFISCLVTMFILIFEMITTTVFFKKYGDSLVESINYWQEYFLDVDSQKEILKEYMINYEKAGVVKKVILAYKFRRYYNGLCNIEKEVKKTKRRLNSMNKWF